MSKFCVYCGRPLAEGEVCNCTAGTATKFDVPKVDTSAVTGFFESMKNRMGIGDPELNKGDAFEKNKWIIPDCVKANENEIPIKQYTVASLRNRIFGITYTKAIGRMEVTSKRVVFRAPGRCLAGRTTLQHEVSVEEIAGLEARREYVFNKWDLFIGVLVSLIAGSIINGLIYLITMGNLVGLGILAFLFGIAGCVPFFILKKKWLLKLLCLGASFLPLLSAGGTISDVRTSDVAAFFGGLLTFLGYIPLILSIIALILFSIKPNLVLVIKNKFSNETIDIQRRKNAIFSWKDTHTGYAEVIPADDAEKCIREINAIISDVQKLGDNGVKKWRIG